MTPMDKLKFIILPILLAILSGILSPIIVERWKQSSKDAQKLLLLEQRIEKIEESLGNLNNRVDKAIPHLENELKDVEVQISHDVGVLKGRLPETTPVVKKV